MPTRLEALENIYNAFSFFACDFEFLEEPSENKIYFALDNDVFSFVLSPQDNLNYVNILEEKASNASFLRSQAYQLAVRIRELVNNDNNTVVALPYHAIEYNDTIISLMNKVLKKKYLLNRNIEKVEKYDDFSDELLNLIEKKTGKITKHAFKKDLDDLVDQLLNHVSVMLFAESQLKALIKKKGTDRIIPFNDILESKEVIDNENYNEFEKQIDRFSKREKSSFALENDVRSLLLVTNYNSNHVDKKLVLVTGDKGIHETYKLFFQKYRSDNNLYAVRHPKYFLPFLNNDNNFFSKDNRKVLEKFSIQLNDLFDAKTTIHSLPDETSKNKIIEIIDDIKELLNLDTFKHRFLDELSSSASKKLKEDIEKVSSSRKIQDILNKNTIELLRDITNNLYLLPILKALMENFLNANEFKYFFRYPYVIAADSEDKQKIIDKLTSNILYGSLPLGLDDIQKKLSDYYLAFLNAVATNLFAEKKIALEYIEQARSFVSEEDETKLFKLNESYLFESFVFRTNLKTAEDVENATKAIRKIDKSKERDIDRFRRKIEECLLATTILILNFQDIFGERFQVYNIPTDDLELAFKTISNSLHQTRENMASVLKECSSKDIKKRVEFHIYMNIATLYLFNRFFLKIPEDDLHFNKSFFKEHIVKYARFPNRIGFKNIVFYLIKLALAENDDEKIKNRQLSIEKIAETLDKQRNNEIKLLPYEARLLNDLQSQLFNSS